MLVCNALLPPACHVEKARDGRAGRAMTAYHRDRLRSAENKQGLMCRAVRALEQDAAHVSLARSPWVFIRRSVVLRTGYHRLQQLVSNTLLNARSL